MTKPGSAFFLILLSLWAKPFQGQAVRYELDPARTKIEFSVSATMHTVHGNFQLKHGLIHFNPTTEEAGGLVVVDVKSGNTGNEGRDRKMHRVVLQSDRFPEATFKPTRITGAGNLRQNPTVHVEGILNVNGADHPLVLEVPVQQSGDELISTIRFVVPYTQWGLKNPSTLLLHVNEKATVEITASGRLAQGAAIQ